MTNLFYVVMFILLFVNPIAARAESVAGFIEVNGASIYYEEQGSGQPLILIHGGGLTHHMWKSFAAKASQNYRVIVIDSRGHGKSTNPTGHFSYEAMSEDVVEVIRKLEIKQPILVGYSDGGMIALTLAARHPKLIKAIVVGGATHRFAATRRYFDGMEAFYATRSKKLIRRHELEELERNHNEMTRKLEKLHTDWRRLTTQIWPMWTTRRVLSDATLSKIKVPVLVIIGDRDEFFSVDDANDLYRTLNKGELFIIPNGDHSMFRTMVDTFELGILQFAGRVEEAG